jgi:hypothetical protein
MAFATNGFLLVMTMRPGGYRKSNMQKLIYDKELPDSG